MSLAAVRSELAAVVKAAAPKLTVYSYEHPDPNAPAAIVTWTDPIPMQGGLANGEKRFTMVVRLIVGATDPMLSTGALDDLVGETLRDAIENHEATSWSLANPAYINPPEPLNNETIAIDLVVNVTAKV